MCLAFKPQRFSVPMRIFATGINPVELCLLYKCAFILVMKVFTMTKILSPCALHSENFTSPLLWSL